MFADFASQVHSIHNISDISKCSYGSRVLVDGLDNEVDQVVQGLVRYLGSCF